MSHAKITRKDVEHVARLARLALSDEEKERYTAQLEAILEFIDKLNQLDTKDVPPTTHVIPVSNIWREDKVEANRLGDPAAIVKNAPEAEGPFFKVKKIIE
jgi:aspartyl-tRNA(Asn)/glutamyl-tRNA(Gln) amidotransferase subunit C